MKQETEDRINALGKIIKYINPEERLTWIKEAGMLDKGTLEDYKTENGAPIAFDKIKATGTELRLENIRWKIRKKSIEEMMEKEDEKNIPIIKAIYSWCLMLPNWEVWRSDQEIDQIISGILNLEVRGPNSSTIRKAIKVKIFTEYFRKNPDMAKPLDKNDVVKSNSNWDKIVEEEILLTEEDKYQD